MKSIYATVLGIFIITQPLSAQQLDSILPVFLQHGSLTDSVSFILTATDYSLWQGKPVRYASSIQIIDAAHPWPPRWYATSPVDTNLKKSNTSSLPVINAFEQNGKMIFDNIISKQYVGGHKGQHEAVLMCNRDFELTDTFYKPGNEVDVHDFAINTKGEKLYFLACDTTLDMRNLFANGPDSIVTVTYEKVQIDNKKNETVFTWDPVKALGLNAMYKPYAYEKAIINTRLTLDWSHGNSLCWDKDGNILYSYKYIGIGKVSRQDGHLMWHVDRNNQKAGPGSDSLPIFLQHDLSFVKDNNPQSTYTVLSNGDSMNPHCSAYRFTVKENKQDPDLKIVKRFTSDSVPQTGAGNYDVEANGDYLINYGIYKGDTVAKHILFDYRQNDDRLLSRYVILPKTFCYRVHRFRGALPPRPSVIKNKGILFTEDGCQNITWYELFGQDLGLVTLAGTGTKFRPLHNGYYCAVEKYGIGYVVSEIIKYSK